MSGIRARLSASLSEEAHALALTGPAAQIAFRAALAGVLSVVVAAVLQLENPYWAGITGFAMLQRDVFATVSRSIDRVVGTMIGAVIGYFAVATASHHGLFLLLCMAAATIGVYGQERIAHGYALVLGCVTVLLVMFGSLSAPEASLSIAVYRALEITVGVAAACAVDFALAPDRPDTPPTLHPPGIWAKPVDVDLLVIALTTGLAVAAVPPIWTTFDLPGLGQTPITAFVIMMALRRDPRWTALNRAIGCVIGGAYGLLCMALAGDALLVWLALMFLGLFLSGHIKHRNGDASYVGQQSGVAVIMAMVQGLAPSTNILPAIERLVGIFGGIVLAGVFQNLLSPLVRRVLRWILGYKGAAGGK